MVSKSKAYNPHFETILCTELVKIRVEQQIVIFLTNLNLCPLYDYTPEGENNGHSWGEDAFAVIQDGIDRIEHCGTVYVAAGMYQENVTLKNGVDLIGSGSESTTIDGNDNGLVISVHDCFANVVKGFTITNGGGYGPAGGMYIAYSTLTVTNCTFVGNTVDYPENNAAGGMYTHESSPTVTNCTFIGNHVPFADGYAAGGICNYKSSPVVSNCTFVGNRMLGPFYPGGGMVRFQSDTRATNCVFWGNAFGQIWADNYDDIIVCQSNVEGGWEGEGNIDTDPLYADPGYLTTPCNGKNGFMQWNSRLVVV